MLDALNEEEPRISERVLGQLKVEIGEWALLYPRTIRTISITGNRIFTGIGISY